NIRFANYPAPYLMASELGRYRFDMSMSMAIGDVADRNGAEPGAPDKDTYIIFTSDRERYEKAGYTIEPHDMVAVAYR
ncbi:MAG: hypothetical protein J6X38_01345, partial [Abditibacteriota bacterium]|nr:hypothetical protein [Abditibacteriota bacterium]